MPAPIVSHNTPALGSISWTDFGCQLYEVGYPIAGGSTSKRFVWWRYNNGSPTVEDGDILPDGEQGNLVINGNMDVPYADVTTLPAYWNTGGWNSPHFQNGATCELMATQGFGANSLCFTTGTVSNNTSSASAQTLAPIAVTPGERIYMRCWSKGLDGAGGGIYMRMMNHATGFEIGANNVNGIENKTFTTSWQKYTGYFDIPAGVTQVRMFVLVTQGAGLGKRVLIDNVSLSRAVIPDALSEEDQLLFLNRKGIGAWVPSLSIMDGSLLVSGSIIADAIGVNQINTFHLGAEVVTANKIAANSIGANQIAANAITASEIAAHAITAEKLTIGAVGGDMVANGSFEDGVGGWIIVAGGGSAGVVQGVSSSGANALVMVTGANDIYVGTDPDLYIPVSPGGNRSWYVGCRAGASTVVAGGFYMRAYWYDENKTQVGFTDIVGNRALDTNWATIEKKIPVNVNAHYMGIQLIQITDNVTTYVDQVFAQEVVVSAQIGDGEITTNHMVANTISGNVITTNTLSGNAVTTNTLNANKITTNSITATQIAGNTITGNEISANSVWGNRIVVNTLNGNTIIANTINGNAITVNTLNGNAIVANTINGNAITTNTLNGNVIIGNTVSGNAITTNTLNANKITTNTITATQIAANTITTTEIQTNTIRTSNMVISNFSNMLSNGGFENGSADLALGANTTVGTIASPPNGGTQGLIINSNGAILDTYGNGLNGFPVQPGEVYYSSVQVRKTTTGVAGMLGLQATLSLDGTTALTYPAFQNMFLSAMTQNTWYTLSGKITIPAGNNRMVPRVSVRQDVPTGDTIHYDNWILTRASDANLIVDGTITTNAIAANAIVSNKISANAINATHISSNSVTSNSINANAINAVHISANSITSNAINANAVNTIHLSANAVVANKISANAINATHIGANVITSVHIASNSIYTRQLNVQDYTNYMAGADFEDANAVPFNLAGSAPWFIDTAQAHSGTKSLNVSGTMAKALYFTVPVQEGDEFYFEYWGKKTSDWNGTSGNSKLRIGDQVAGHLLSLDYGSAALSSSAWTKRTSSLVIPAGVTFIQAQLNTDGTVGNAWLDDFVMRRKTAGTSIIDGTVNTQHLAANSIVANKISVNAINASHISANAVNAASLTANAIDGKTITGATLQTNATGERIVIRNDGSGGIIESYTGLAGEALPTTIDPAVILGDRPGITLKSGTSNVHTNRATVQLFSGNASSASTVYLGGDELQYNGKRAYLTISDNMQIVATNGTIVTGNVTVLSGSYVSANMDGGDIGAGNFKNSVDARVDLLAPKVTMTTGSVGTGAFRDSVDARAEVITANHVKGGVGSGSTNAAGYFTFTHGGTTAPTSIQLSGRNAGHYPYLTGGTATTTDVRFLYRSNGVALSSITAVAFDWTCYWA